MPLINYDQGSSVTKLALVLLGGCCFLIGSDRLEPNLLARAARNAAPRPNPYSGKAAAVGAGMKLYARECASCHGKYGEGSGKVPPLMRSPVVTKAPPGALFWVLRNGSLHRGMPSFAHLPEAQRWEIIAFIQRESRQ
ncbi:MAG: hypothetical protein DLM73_06190 [Chthoniobacterales bacterium]|nr:MAG: hypothetical protein DLM73_06190 [Chthoniobacterales bacterium]